MSQKIKIDSEALENMGLNPNAVWLVEYDIPSAYTNTHTGKIGKGYTKEQAEELRKIRNTLMFELKFKLGAIKNLYSSWFIDAERLPEAEQVCEKLRQSLITAGFKDKANKVKLIPIFTTDEGFETFEDRKAEFLIQFAMESHKAMEKGLKDLRMSPSSLWRCKKSVEWVTSLGDSLQTHERYNEIMDTIHLVQDQIGEYEDKIEQLKARKKKK